MFSRAEYRGKGIDVTRNNDISHYTNRKLHRTLDESDNTKNAIKPRRLRTDLFKSVGVTTVTEWE